MQTPMCQTCAQLPLLGDELCIFNTSSCSGVKPGHSCEIDCAKPYVRVGSMSKANCPAGNSIPGRMMTWSKPVCECPQPAAQQGYINGADGTWRCTEGFAGTPEIVCQPMADCAGVSTYLIGCKQLVPCAMPMVDLCRYDISRCQNVQPGESCQVHCKKPLLGNYTTAVCVAGNTDPLRELDYYPLTCLLEECPDPSPWPEGYTKDLEGRWKCAEGYNGTARNRCELGNTWSEDCAAVAALTGCYKVVNCQAPTLYDLDVCKYDLGACQNIEPGQTCEVHCKNPFTGIKTEASCPMGNTNPDGLMWEQPPCIIDSCDEPSTVPAGYRRTGLSDYTCGSSYTGYAVKVCTPTLSCEATPELTGCKQLVPCVAPPGDCRYDTYGCISVQPGATCQIRCKVPFAGTITTATCPSGNTGPAGLVWETPNCTIDTCADPPEGNGYIKVYGEWECAAGYSGRVAKRCIWVEEKCEAEPELSGCVREVPCVLPPAGPEESCMYDMTECLGAMPGKLCSIRCKYPYLGTAADMTCPIANTNAGKVVDGDMPDCGCLEPSPLAPGYNMTVDQIDLSISYFCEQGYAGKAEKLCKAGTGATCTVDPIMVGCAIPLSCEASWLDTGSGEGTADGTVLFGPAMLDGTINEDQIQRYDLYWADDCDERIGEVLAEIPVKPETDRETCCRNDVYRADVTGTPPQGAVGFTVIAVVPSGRAPLGVFLPLDTELLTKALANSWAVIRRPDWTLLAIAAVAALTGSSQRRSR